MATVETIKAFEVNRIVYREYSEVGLWTRKKSMKKVANAGDFKYSNTSVQQSDISETILL